MIAWLLAATWASADVRVTGDPQIGGEFVVEVVDADGRPAPGTAVRVIHRAGLWGESQVAVGLTDSLGRVRYVPEIAGETLIRAGEEEVRVHVAWPTAPAGPVSHVAAALALALTLVAWGVRRPEIPR
jgi:hypothetical protein